MAAADSLTAGQRTSRMNIALVEAAFRDSYPGGQCGFCRPAAAQENILTAVAKLMKEIFGNNLTR
jgi:aerobic-type carbon monoxide dehydrogenase small subunit (CoxS/CutS family)